MTPRERWLAWMRFEGAERNMDGLGDGFRWWSGAEGGGVAGFSAGRLRVGLGLFPGEWGGLTLCAAQLLAECADLGLQGIHLGLQCRHFPAQPRTVGTSRRIRHICIIGRTPGGVEKTLNRYIITDITTGMRIAHTFFPDGSSLMLSFPQLVEVGE